MIAPEAPCLVGCLYGDGVSKGLVTVRKLPGARCVGPLGLEISSSSTSVEYAWRHILTLCRP